jgi:hypothetical protein
LVEPFLVGGRRRENHWSRGRFWDDVVMGITAEEWWAKHGPRPNQNRTLMTPNDLFFVRCATEIKALPTPDSRLWWWLQPCL